MNGVSKKLCMTMAGVVVIGQMAEGAQDKLPYAIIVGVVCVAYKIAQTALDWKNRRKKTSGE